MENFSLYFFLLMALANSTRVCIYYQSNNVCRLCTCGSNGMEISVTCKERRLMNVPKTIHSNVTSLDLRTNCISKLRNNSFTGLHHLKILDLSNNYIYHIEIASFWPLIALEELRLEKTNLGLLQLDLRPGIFRGLTNLKSLNLKNNIQPSTVNASRLPDKTFSDLVGLENLDINGAYNYMFGPGFENLTNFKTLTMSGWDGHCEMVRLESTTFTYVSYLQNINIINCKLTYIDPGAFKPLKNLQTLNLSDNTDLGFPNFRRLIEGLKDTSTRILNITSIVSPYGLGSRLFRDDALNLSMTRLEEVHLNRNAIEIIDYGVLSSFPPTLRKLYLRQNRLVFSFYMYEIFNLGNLTVFDAGNQQPSIYKDERRGRMQRSIDIRGKSFPTFENNESLSMVFMEARNKGGDTIYETSDYFKTNQTIFTAKIIWQYLKHRRFRRDSFEGKDLHNWTHVRKETLKAKSNSFILRRKRSSTMPITKQYVVTPKDQLTTEESLVSIKAIPKTVSTTPKVLNTRAESEIPKLALTTFICSGSMSNIALLDFNDVENKITYMDISFNDIPKLANLTFAGLSKLEFLNLSNNQISSVEFGTFAPLHSLIYLDLSNNHLQNFINKTLTANWFWTLSNLQVLNISHNSISYVPQYMFQTLHCLQVLDLSMNNLNDFNVDLSNLTELKILDLSFNHLSYLESYIMNHMDNIANNRNISLDLSGNKMVCTCKTLPFLHWLKQTNVNLINNDHYYCSLENGIIQHLNNTKFLGRLEESCKSYVMVYIGTSIAITLILVSILCFLVYRNRWKLRYLYHMVKLKLPTKPIENAEDAFKNDGFISYSEEDVLFVKNCLIQELEVNRGQKVVISDRDFLPGDVLTTAILRAIRESRKTVSLVSNASVKNKWWIFELHMAQMESIHTKRDALIVVLLENIPNKDLPVEVLNVLQSYPSIEFPNDMHAQMPFWITLHEYLKKK